MAYGQKRIKTQIYSTCKIKYCINGNIHTLYKTLSDLEDVEEIMFDCEWTTKAVSMKKAIKHFSLIHCKL